MSSKCRILPGSEAPSLRHAVLVILLAVTLGVLAPLEAGAQEILKATLVEEEDSFLERYDPQVNVSGHVVVGVMAASAASRLATDELKLLPSELVVARESRDVCLRVSSQDGVYATTAHYNLPAGAEKNAVHLPYPSKYKEVVGSFKTNQVAISATAGSCSEPTNDYVVVGAADDATPGSVHIYVNGMDATDVSARIKAGETWNDANECRKVKAAQQRAYEYLCRIDLPDDETAHDVQILRERWGTPQPTVEIKVDGGRR